MIIFRYFLAHKNYFFWQSLYSIVDKEEKLLLILHNFLNNPFIHTYTKIYLFHCQTIRVNMYFCSTLFIILTIVECNELQVW